MKNISILFGLICVLFIIGACAGKGKRTSKSTKHQPSLSRINQKESSDIFDIDAFVKNLDDFRQSYDLSKLSAISTQKYKDILSQAFDEALAMSRLLDSTRALYYETPDLFLDLANGVEKVGDINESVNLFGSIGIFLGQYNIYFDISEGRDLFADEFEDISKTAANATQALSQSRPWSLHWFSLAFIRFKFIETTIDREKWSFYAKSLKSLLMKDRKSSDLFELLTNIYRHAESLMFSVRYFYQTMKEYQSMYQVLEGIMEREYTIDPSTQPRKAAILESFHFVKNSFAFLMTTAKETTEIFAYFEELNLFERHSKLEPTLRRIFSMSEVALEDLKSRQIQSFGLIGFIESLSVFRLWLHLSPLVPRGGAFELALSKMGLQKPSDDSFDNDLPIQVLREPKVYVDTMDLAELISLDNVQPEAITPEFLKEIWIKYREFTNVTDHHISIARAKYKHLRLFDENVLEEENVAPIIGILTEIKADMPEVKTDNDSLKSESSSESISSSPNSKSEKKRDVKIARKPINERNLCFRLLNGERSHHRYNLTSSSLGSFRPILDSNQMLTFCKVEKGTLKSGLATLKWADIESLVRRGFGADIISKYGSIREFRFGELCKFILHKPHSGRVSRDNSVGLAFAIELRSGLRKCGITPDSFKIRRGSDK